jgi:hypothetical protein
MLLLNCVAGMSTKFVISQASVYPPSAFLLKHNDHLTITIIRAYY